MVNLTLRIALIRNGLRQVEAARRIGRSAGWLSGVVNNWVTPSEADRAKLGELLGVDQRELFPHLRERSR